MARRAEPAAVKKAKGNPGRRPIAETAPDASAPAESTGSLPAWLDTRRAVGRGKGAARSARMTGLTDQIWNFCYPELSRLNLVKQLDEIALGIFCRAVAEWIDATVTIDREGPTYVTSSNHVEKLHRPHPATRIRREAYAVIKDQGEVLGLNPAARQRLFMAMANRGHLPAGNDNKPRDGELPLAAQPVKSAIGVLAAASTQH